MKKNKRRVYDVLLGLCILVFVVSGGTLGYKIVAQRKNDGRLEALSEILEEQAVAEAGTEGDKAAGEEQTDQTQEDLSRTQREARVKAYSKVKEQNGDMVGWVKVEGTKIDYPVLQSPDTPDFYLKHDFDKKSSPYGAPYVSEMCDLSADCKNILVYGHHMKNGSMFAALDGYLDPDFLEEHPVVEFDTMESYGDYEVMGVFALDAADQEDPIYDWIYCSDEEAFGQFVSYVKRRSVYDTGIDAQWGDHLVTLVTCEYTHKNGRLIVVAKKVWPVR